MKRNIVKKIIEILALCFVPWCAAVAQHAQDDGLVHTLGPDWKSVYEISHDLSYQAIDLARNGDTVLNWKELVTIQAFVEPPRFSPEEVLNRLKALREKRCPGVSQWDVIATEDGSVLYEWHAGPCDGWPEQVEVARIISGKHCWYMLHYAAKVHELAPDIRAEWIKTFSDATFDSVTRSFDPEWMSVDMDETVPFIADKAMAAMKSAMESQSCSVSKESADHIECKRSRVGATWTKGPSGGESVTATLEADGDKTHVVVTTGMGFYARAAKRNYSTPIFEGMMRNLENAKP